MRDLNDILAERQAEVNGRGGQTTDHAQHQSPGEGASARNPLGPGDGFAQARRSAIRLLCPSRKKRPRIRDDRDAEQASATTQRLYDELAATYRASALATDGKAA